MPSATESMLILALLVAGYLLVTAVLYALSIDLKHAIDRHELIRAARIKRAEYLRELEAREAHNSVEIEHAGPQGDPYAATVPGDAPIPLGDAAGSSAEPARAAA